MNIAVVWYFNQAEKVYPYWKDGLRKAIEEIGKDHTVHLFLGEHPIEDDNYDTVLVWGDSECPFLNDIEKFKGKKGIFLTTDPWNIPNLRKLDVVYCESQPVYEAVRRSGLHAVKAFGVDQDFYNPNEVKKDIPYFYPATFSPWKRQSDLAYLGKDLWLIGTVQPDGYQELEACRKAECNIAEGYFAPRFIKEYYDRAQHIPIPAIHGSERTVLEAMSMNHLPMSMNPINLKSQSYIKEYKDWYLKHKGTPRDFILEFYKYQDYVKAIMKGLE